MPKDIIDYSQTIIYKIYCKDTTITDVYIGHTTNFVKRKYQHKICCNGNNKLKIYETIRSNGGWENWDMVEIAKYNCKDATEARIKEQEHYELNMSSLNNKTPYRNLKKYYCHKCNVQCLCLSNYNKHIESLKHKNNSDTTCIPTVKNVTNMVQKVAKNHHCEICDYFTCKIADYKKHLQTLKHKNRENETFETGIKLKVAKNLQCICGISFNNRITLWRHKKKCNFENNEYVDKKTTDNLNSALNLITPELVMELIKDNKEMKQIILEQNNTINNLVKNGVNTSVNTNSLNNNNNKTFNLQFFLNETCKDAMNIMDFVESIKLQLSDLEKVGEVGYTQGISNIITTNLKALDVTQRPVHCTDKKRETMYIKDANKWEKEDEENTRLRKMIRNVATKNIKMLAKFREKYPDYNNSSSKISDKYDKMALEAMGGDGDNDKEKETKIIHNISKCVVIDKYVDEN
jgi:hypothetical protein